MATNDVYRVTLNYLWNAAIECSNVFYYRQIAGAAFAADELNFAFAADVFGSIENVAPEFITFQLQQVVNVGNPIDFFEGDYADNPGDRTEVSDPCPSFLALQFRSARAYPGTRSARKRFPFLYEADIDGNSVEAALTGSVVVAALETALAARLTSGSNQFDPVVVAHPVELGVVPTVRYTIAPGSYSVQSKVSTQNTRKS